MASTTFIDRTTIIEASWLNDVNSSAYPEGLVAKATPASGDVMLIKDSTTSYSFKKLTWGNLVTALGSTYMPKAGGTFTGRIDQAVGAAIASAGTTDLRSATGNLVHITGTTGITVIQMNAGQQMELVFDGSLLLTHNATTLNLPGGANITTQPGDRLSFASDGTTVYCTSYTQALVAPVIPYRFLTGFTMGPITSATATMPIAAGQCTDSTGSAILTLAAAITKTGANWAAGSGNGGCDVGSIAVNTWYDFFAIKNITTGAVDVIFTAAASPTMPSGWTLSRYIGSMPTNGSAQWFNFIQTGRRFMFTTPLNVYSSGGTGTAAITFTTYAPGGRKVLTHHNVSPQGYVYMSDPDATDLAVNTTGSPGATYIGNMDVVCNTSRTVRIRHSLAGTLYVNSLGWTDFENC
jgi:hypothetical protein